MFRRTKVITNEYSILGFCESENDLFECRIRNARIDDRPCSKTFESLIAC